MSIENWKDCFFKVNESTFEKYTLEIFTYQAKHNTVYSKYLRLLNIEPLSITSILEIPFLPIQFFKSHKVQTNETTSTIVFESSGTTGQVASQHYVSDIGLYKASFTKAFELFFGLPKEYCFLALLPSYLERGNSSLVYMAKELIKQSNHPDSGFFLNDYDNLYSKLTNLNNTSNPTILLGVSFALLEFAERYSLPLTNTSIIETGGMKGRKEEITRKELHSKLKQAFGVDKIYSEYGMTELLSQAYSLGDERFSTPPWMKILIRDPYDPFNLVDSGISGGINIIDLANIHSCSFIQTEDLGKVYDDGRFEVLGRLDNTELRGCNLMIE